MIRVLDCVTPTVTLMLLAILMSFVVPLTADCPVHVANVSDLEQSVLQRSRFQVAADLLHTVAVQQRLQNVLLSPSTIHSALLLMFFASSGSTEKLLREVLHLPDTMSKDKIVGQYIQERNSSGSPYQIQEQGHEYVTADGMYVENGLKIRHCIDSLFPKKYHTADLRQQSAAVREIRHWLEKETNNKIDLNIPWKTRFNFNFLQKSTALISGAYFKGIWLKPFQNSKTKRERFYTDSDRFIEVDMMGTTGFFSLWSGRQIPMKILELPYMGRNVNMIILLPSKKPHTKVMLEFLHSFTNETFEQVLKLLSSRFPSTVQVRLPKTVIEKEYDFEQVLKHLGAGLLFGAVTHFQDLMEKSRYVTVVKTVYHKSKISIDEGECEEKELTSNKTSIIKIGFKKFLSKISGKIEPSKPKSIKKFFANRPFIYFIYDKASKLILFSGIFYSP